VVEEDEYRSTYHALNRRRCAFEKAVLSHRCDCICSTRFYLADREGISCDSEGARQQCLQLVALLRQNARFALRITSTAAELPHAKEIKVQNGGLFGLQRVLRPDLSGERVRDVAGLVKLGRRTFGSLEQLPYPQIVKYIVSFEGRRRPRSKR
jgi:hypothetical protein